MLLLDVDVRLYMGRISFWNLMNYIRLHAEQILSYFAIIIYKYKGSLRFSIFL